jgi:hypothetical protein
MRLLPLSIGFGVALAMAPISAASAHEFYHHHHYGLVGGIFGLAGAVVVGAATIVTAPIVILADAISGPRHYRREGYDQGYGGYDGGGPGYDDEASDGYGPRDAYRGAPENGYYAPPRDYAPSQDYDRGRYEPEAQAYNQPPRGYARDDDYAQDPAQAYDSPQGYGDRPYDSRDDE